MLGLAATHPTMYGCRGIRRPRASTHDLAAQGAGWPALPLAFGGDTGPVPLRCGDAADPPDGPLASQARRDAFSELFACYSAPLVDYLYGMTHEREWAADLAQETFAHAMAATSDLATITHPRAWLYRIATNLALTALGRRRRFRWLPLSYVEPESSAESSGGQSALPAPDLPYADLADTVAERDAVWGVLAELPPRWRAVLLLQTAAGFEVAEIAVQLHLTEANTRKILFRAKERFRALHAQAERRLGNGGDPR